MFIRIGFFKMFDTEVFYALHETLLLDIFEKIYFHFYILQKYLTRIALIFANYFGQLVQIREIRVIRG